LDAGYLIATALVLVRMVLKKDIIRFKLKNLLLNRKEWLIFKNYKLRSHGEGFEAVRTFCGQRGSWNLIFCDFVLMSF